jgi:hypothetical protein
MNKQDKQRLARSISELHTTLLAVCTDDQLGAIDDMIVKLVNDVETILHVKIKPLLDEMHADLVR